LVVAMERCSLRQAGLLLTEWFTMSTEVQTLKSTVDHQKTSQLIRAGNSNCHQSDNAFAIMSAGASLVPPPKCRGCSSRKVYIRRSLRAGWRTFVGPTKAALRLTVFEIRIDPFQIITVLRGICVAHRINFTQHFVFPGFPVRRALPRYRWSFLCSHASPESSLLLAESKRLRCGGSSK
jgi:hypothetical protein